MPNRTPEILGATLRIAVKVCGLGFRGLGPKINRESSKYHKVPVVEKVWAH